MSSDEQGESRYRYAYVRSRHRWDMLAPHDLMTVYDNLEPMIHAQCADLASSSNPVMFTFIDIRAPQDSTSMRGVPADIARALWTQGLQALRDIGDATLDPSRQIDALSQLGLQSGFCPNLAVLVFQYWPIIEVIDGRLQKSQSYEPRAGVPRMLQVELRVHGCEPLVTEWRVLPRDGGAYAVPPPPRHFVGPVNLAPPRLPPASAAEDNARMAAEAGRRRREEIEAKLASMQLPTFVVRLPYVSDGLISLKDPELVTYIAGESGVAKDDPLTNGSVTLQVIDGLVVPTYYETGTESYECLWPRGTTLLVYNGSEPGFSIVVIQPLKVVPSGP